MFSQSAIIYINFASECCYLYFYECLRFKRLDNELLINNLFLVLSRDSKRRLLVRKALKAHCRPCLVDNLLTLNKYKCIIIGVSIIMSLHILFVWCVKINIFDMCSYLLFFWLMEIGPVISGF